MVVDFQSKDIVVAFSVFSALAVCSLVSWLVIGVTYLKGERMSKPPGKLISAQGFNYFTDLLLNLIFSSYQFSEGYLTFHINLEFCEVAYIVLLYTRTMCLCTDLCVSIELIHLVNCPHKQKTLVSLHWYMFACHLTALIFAIEKFLSKVSWKGSIECIAEESQVQLYRLHSFIELSGTNLICAISAVNCAYLLVKMHKSRQLTNFIVAHAIWIETIGLTMVFSLNLYIITESNTNYLVSFT